VSKEVKKGLRRCILDGIPDEDRPLVCGICNFCFVVVVIMMVRPGCDLSVWFF